MLLLLTLVNALVNALINYLVSLSLVGVIALLILSFALFSLCAIEFTAFLKAVLLRGLV